MKKVSREHCFVVQIIGLDSMLELCLAVPEELRHDKWRMAGLRRGHIPG